jgi:DNA-binding transcriptional ArsR family regulator
MPETNTKNRIMRELRNTDEPALSARMLADRLDVSVKTINKHVERLTEAGHIETSEIGNATAYYVPFTDLPSNKKPDHTCGRCGREVNERHDFAKLEYDTFFERGNPEATVSTVYIFCRFCYSDFINWVEDPNLIGFYMYVHGWNIPTEQLEEVRDDPETTSAPNPDVLDAAEHSVFKFIEANEDEYEHGVPTDVVTEFIESELGKHDWEADEILRNLEKGFVFRRYNRGYRAAK